MPGISDDYISSACEKNGKILAELKRKVIKYLEEGVEFISMPGVKYGVTSKDKDNMISVGISILSDGVWRWPNYLVHYVDKYDIDLPSDFIQNMIDNEWDSRKDHLET